jgi:hypothetical protein
MLLSPGAGGGYGSAGRSSNENVIGKNFYAVCPLSRAFAVLPSTVQDEGESMIALLKARMGATLPMSGAGLLPATPAMARGAASDLFSYRAGADIIEYPDGRNQKGPKGFTVDPSARDAYADYYTAEKTSSKAGGC